MTAFADRMGGLGVELVAGGHSPPVLILADTAAVAAHAPAWLTAFDELGWEYRVRVCGDVPDDVETLVDEAGSLRARTIVAVGDAPLLAAAVAAATRAGIACVALPPAN